MLLSLQRSVIFKFTVLCDLTAQRQKACSLEPPAGKIQKLRADRTETVQEPSITPSGSPYKQEVRQSGCA
eukprot:1161163-Pelagomonas_calceolata.AAC.12